MMSELMVQPALLAVLAGAVLTSLAVLLVWRARRQQRVLQQRSDTLRRDLSALTAAAVSVGQRVLELERRQRRLAERQDQLDVFESANQPYEQAIRMVHKGAGIEELVEICGLSRGEAELIAMLHRLDRSA